MSETKTVKIECPVTEENTQGFYIVNAEDVTEGMKVFVEKAPADMTVTELKAKLAAAGMEIPEDAKKADLVALYESLAAQ